MTHCGHLLSEYSIHIRKYVHSVGYALAGLGHAFVTERNFPVFVIAYAASLVFTYVFHPSPMEFIAVMMSGGFFLSIELLNTALERFADAFDTHTRKQDDVHHQAIKRTKDVAAAAALVAILAWVSTLTMVLWPRILPLLK